MALLSSQAVRSPSRRRGRERSALLLALACLAVATLAPATSARAIRIKDIAEFEGMRGNALSGYGVVVGLQGTGDGQQGVFTIQSILSMLRRRGVVIDVDPKQVRTKNAAAVTLTATLPPFAKSGNRIDVSVASIGDAKSLRGGTLVMSPLFGGDQQVYAVAQGAVSLGGGFTLSAPGASETVGHPTAGIITSGATVEREVPSAFGQDGRLLVSLRIPDATTASRVAETIDAHLGGRGNAVAADPKTIDVRLADADASDVMALLPSIEVLEVTADHKAKVVVNERTGTIIMGAQVRVLPVAIAHGSLQVAVTTDYDVSQPNAFANGQTVVVPESTIVAKEGKKYSLSLLKPGVSIGQLVAGLNALGVTPQDLIAVLEAIKSAGALEAEMEIM